MTLRRTVLLAAIFSVAPTALVLAQTAPPTDQTSPSSASSPHQRDTTKSNAPEASPTDNTQGTNPSDASSPHQRQATSRSAQMKECVAKQQTSNSGMSAADARKACKAQLKGPG
jgi:hypothetical protein